MCVSVLESTTFLRHKEAARRTTKWCIGNDSKVKQDHHENDRFSKMCTSSKHVAIIMLIGVL